MQANYILNVSKDTSYNSVICHVAASRQDTAQDGTFVSDKLISFILFFISVRPSLSLVSPIQAFLTIKCQWWW
jgi:hypothetical protein